MKRIGSWFSGLGTAAKVVVLGVTFMFALGAVGAVADSISPPAEKSPSKLVDAPPTTKAPVITTEVEEITEAIPFETKTVKDAALAVGVTKVRTEGEDGVLTHRFRVTYTDGQETDREALPDVITTEPVQKVIVKGTKKPQPKVQAKSSSNCSNGTYVNSSGNTVCRPVKSSSAPAGATAKCRDGSYSFSQHRSGTCSRHGGVAQWL